MKLENDQKLLILIMNITMDNDYDRNDLTGTMNMNQEHDQD